MRKNDLEEVFEQSIARLPTELRLGSMIGREFFDLADEYFERGKTLSSHHGFHRHLPLGSAYEEILEINLEEQREWLEKELEKRRRSLCFGAYNVGPSQEEALAKMEAAKQSGGRECLCEHAFEHRVARLLATDKVKFYRLAKQIEALVRAERDREISEKADILQSAQFWGVKLLSRESIVKRAFKPLGFMLSARKVRGVLILEKDIGEGWAIHLTIDKSKLNWNMPYRRQNDNEIYIGQLEFSFVAAPKDVKSIFRDPMSLDFKMETFFPIGRYMFPNVYYEFRDDSDLKLLALAYVAMYQQIEDELLSRLKVGIEKIVELR